MKRGFLKTFIVLGLFAIFFSINSQFINAQDVPDPYNLDTVVENTPKVVEEVGTFWNCVTNPLACTIGTGSWFLIQLASLGLYLSGTIFDKVIETTVLTSGLIDLLYNSSNGVNSGAIVIAWKIVRDLSNIIIVFSLLYLGIKTIIDGQGFADKKTLISVIIVAILINFSLVFTRAVFDVSNFIGAQIGEQIKFNGQNSTQSGITSISAGLVKMIRPTSVMSSVSDPSKSGWGQIWDKVQIAIFTIVTILAVSITLLGASFLLMYRFIIFIVLMITSPFGLVAKFLPWFKGMGAAWWKALKTQAIVLPAFLLTLYISVLFVSILSTGLTNGSTGFVIGSVGGDLEQAARNLTLFFFNFILIIGFLILPLIVPGKIGAAGASLMTNAGNWTVNKVRSMPQIAARGAASATARSGRYFIGDKLATSIGGSTKEKKEALQQRARGNGLDALIARQRLRQSESLKDKTYDIRNTAAIKNSQFGKGMGAGIDSYNSVIKRKQGEYEERKKKEMKAYGYDKVHESDSNKAAIVLAEKARDKEEATLKEHKDHVKFLKENDASIEEITNAQAYVTAQEKVLKSTETKVGELKNLGATQHLEHDSKQFFSRMERFFSSTSRKTLEKIKEENQKKWATAGESKRKRQDKASAKKLDKDLADDTPSGGSDKK